MGIGRDFSLALLNVFMNWICKLGGKAKVRPGINRFIFCKDEMEIKAEFYLTFQQN